MWRNFGKLASLSSHSNPNSLMNINLFLNWQLLNEERDQFWYTNFACHQTRLFIGSIGPSFFSLNFFMCWSHLSFFVFFGFWGGQKTSKHWGIRVTFFQLPNNLLFFITTLYKTESLNWILGIKRVTLYFLRCLIAKGMCWLPAFAHNLSFICANHNDYVLTQICQALTFQKFRLKLFFSTRAKMCKLNKGFWMGFIFPKKYLILCKSELLSRINTCFFLLSLTVSSHLHSFLFIDWNATALPTALCVQRRWCFFWLNVNEDFFRKFLVSVKYEIEIFWRIIRFNFWIKFWDFIFFWLFECFS